MTGGSPPSRILVVEHDPTIAEVIVRYLERDGHRVEWVRDAAKALRRASAEPPDLVILDLRTPQPEVVEMCRALREPSPGPVIMLTVSGDDLDRAVAVEIGAEDYVTKPFSPRELALRVGSLLRRSRGTAVASGAAGGVLRDGDLVVDVGARDVRLGDAAVTLTTREFDLLTHLMRNPRQAFSRAALLHQVWGWSFGDSSTVTVHVRRLREKIEKDPTAPRRIVTVWGVGYRYEPMEG
ncbi:DNA-binding response regulator [Thermopolyspora flexuosa]|uniref:DNA-binding response OmpR family regulator n=1 Tax=Thermopolyspora flexuosa TaxID=103836 RepID=A0A543IPG1_9ACTN|nr:response regulator transcription factor [Thermopolyspora flexuosa]TQM72451.1 DNA-binding response OmpR family regulator [Thermopolyspora flexuosa]GGM70569.1 DNA-binding response regulator [Thermopolyspora flexuosa]